MSLMNDLRKYMFNNKIDMVYIDDSAIISMLYSDLSNVRDIIIMQNSIFIRKIKVFGFLGENSKSNTYLTINDVINTFEITVIGLIFERLKIEDFGSFLRNGNYYFFDISPFFNTLLFFKNEEDLFRLHCSARLTEKIIQRTLKNSSGRRYNQNCIINLFLEECGKVGAKDTHINVIRLNSFDCLTPIFSIDCGISYFGFFSDITRMFCYDMLSREIKERFQFLVELQNATVNIIRENLNIKDLFITLNRRYNSNFMFKRVQSGFGHGIGKRIHEGYSLRSDQKWTFQNGYSFTLEPILSFDDMELRIENMYEVKNGKARRINTLLSDDIITLSNYSNQLESKKFDNELYYTNPEVMIFEGNDCNFLANLSCDSLSKGKVSYLKISKSALTIIKEFQHPSLLTKIKSKYPKDRDYIDFLIAEEILLNKK